MILFDLDHWQEIAITLRQHKLRTALTAFGVIWGIFMLVMLLGVSNGLKGETLARFGNNPNSIFIWAAGPTQMAHQGLDKNRWVQFKPDDLVAIKSRLPDVDLALGINEAGGWQTAQYVVRGNKSNSFITRGTYPEIAFLSSFGLVKGRYINALDNQELRKVAAIGERVYETLFEPGENPIGKNIIIGGMQFKVVGVFKPESMGDNALQDAERVMIPNDTLRVAFNQRDRYGHLRFTPKPGVSSVLLEQKIMAILRERHKVHPQDTGVFGSFNTQKVFQQVLGLFEGIQLFSWCVAIGTLLAGVIGVGNIMLITVKERTREIGLRKALGARPGQVVSMIIQEAMVITLVSGYFGLVLGVLTLEGLKALAVHIPQAKFLAYVSVDFSTALWAVGILAFTGWLAALLPAYKGAKVNPIVALQDE